MEKRKFFYFISYVLILFTPLKNPLLTLINRIGLGKSQALYLFYILMAIIGLIIYSDDYKKSLKNFRKKPGKNFLYVFFSYLTASFFMGLISFSFGTSLFSQEISNKVFLNDHSLLASLFCLGLSSSICDEIVFRSYILEKNKKRLPKFLPPLISCLLFSLLRGRGLGIKGFLIYLPWSISLVFIYKYKRLGIFSSTLSHMIRSSISIILYYSLFSLI